MKKSTRKYLSPDDLSRIRQTVNVPRLIAALGLKVAKETSREAWVHSPFSQDKTASMHIQQDGRWYCHATSQGGGVIELYQAMHGGDCYAAGRALRDLGVCDAAPPPFSGPDYGEGKIQHANRARKAGKQPSLVPFLKSHPEFARRGISERTRLALGCGYLPLTSKSPLANRLVFQIRDAGGQIISHIGRAVSPEQEAKWFFYAGFPKQDHLYNLDFICRDKESREIVAKYGLPIVEGPFDVAKLYEAGIPAIATFGANLGLAQVEKLKTLAGRNKGLRFLLWFDRDQAGAKASAKAETLLQEAGLPYSVFDWNQTFPQDAGHPATIPERIQDACDFEVAQLRALRLKGLI